MASRFSIKEKPTASASPSAWLAMPGFPSCNTHASGEKPAVVSHRAGRAAIEREAIGFVYENGPKTAREGEFGVTKLHANIAVLTNRKFEPDATNQT